MRRWLLIGIFAVFALSTFFAVHLIQASKRIQVPQRRMIQFGNKNLQAEVMKTEAELQRGLSNRTSLASDAAMLFVFPEPDIYEFWMKDMQFPIDIVWIQDDTVVDLVTLPPPKKGESPARHLPKVRAEYVLEIQAGLAKQAGISTGSVIKLPKL